MRRRVNKNSHLPYSHPPAGVTFMQGREAKKQRCSYKDLYLCFLAGGAGNLTHSFAAVHFCNFRQFLASWKVGDQLFCDLAWNFLKRLSSKKMVKYAKKRLAKDVVLEQTQLQEGLQQTFLLLTPTSNTWNQWAQVVSGISNGTPPQQLRNNAAQILVPFLSVGASMTVSDMADLNSMSQYHASYFPEQWEVLGPELHWVWVSFGGESTGDSGHVLICGLCTNTIVERKWR